METIKDISLGKDVYLGPYVNLYGCSIGNMTKVGAFVEIQAGATIGSYCKISSHSFLCEGVTIEDEVFIGHHVVFVNDNHPAATKRGKLKTKEDWVCSKTLVCSGASIGSNSTILGGITIGQGAIIGAGSVVTKDVEPYTVVYGNPARFAHKVY